MDRESLSLRLLTNRLPILVSGDIPVYSPLLIDIADVGFLKYNNHLYKSTLSSDSLISQPETPIDDFDILLYLITSQDGMLEEFLEAVQFFTKLKFSIGQQDNDLLFFCGDKSINRENYGEFINFIKFANCMKDNIPEKEMDEFDKQILEWEKKIAEQDSESGIHVPFKDLVSSVVNMGDNNLNILNIWDINIFTFYEQMKRGQMKERYFIGLRQLLAGAEAKDVDLEYYIQKTD